MAVATAVMWHTNGNLISTSPYYMVHIGSLHIGSIVSCQSHIMLLVHTCILWDLPTRMCLYTCTPTCIYAPVHVHENINEFQLPRPTLGLFKQGCKWLE